MYEWKYNVGDFVTESERGRTGKVHGRSHHSGYEGDAYLILFDTSSSATHREWYLETALAPAVTTHYGDALCARIGCGHARKYHTYWRNGDWECIISSCKCKGFVDDEALAEATPKVCFRCKGPLGNDPILLADDDDGWACEKCRAEMYNNPKATAVTTPEDRCANCGMLLVLCPGLAGWVQGENGAKKVCATCAGIHLANKKAKVETSAATTPQPAPILGVPYILGNGPPDEQGPLLELIVVAPGEEPWNRPEPAVIAPPVAPDKDELCKTCEHPAWKHRIPTVRGNVRHHVCHPGNCNCLGFVSKNPHNTPTCPEPVEKTVTTQDPLCQNIKCGHPKSLHFVGQDLEVTRNLGNWCNGEKWRGETCHCRYFEDLPAVTAQQKCNYAGCTKCGDASIKPDADGWYWSGKTAWLCPNCQDTCEWCCDEQGEPRGIIVLCDTCNKERNRLTAKTASIVPAVTMQEVSVCKACGHEVIDHRSIRNNRNTEVEMYLWCLGGTLEKPCECQDDCIPKFKGAEDPAVTTPTVGRATCGHRKTHHFQCWHCDKYINQVDKNLPDGWVWVNDKKVIAFCSDCAFDFENWDGEDWNDVSSAVTNENIAMGPPIADGGLQTCSSLGTSTICETCGHSKNCHHTREVIPPRHKEWWNAWCSGNDPLIGISFNPCSCTDFVASTIVVPEQSPTDDLMVECMVCGHPRENHGIRCGIEFCDQILLITSGTKVLCNCNRFFPPTIITQKEEMNKYNAWCKDHPAPTQTHCFDCKELLGADGFEIPSDSAIVLCPKCLKKLSCTPLCATCEHASTSHEDYTGPCCNAKPSGECQCRCQKFVPCEETTTVTTSYKDDDYAKWEQLCEDRLYGEGTEAPTVTKSDVTIICGNINLPSATENAEIVMLDESEVTPLVCAVCGHVRDCHKRNRMGIYHDTMWCTGGERGRPCHCQEFMR